MAMNRIDSSIDFFDDDIYGRLQSYEMKNNVNRMQEFLLLLERKSKIDWIPYFLFALKKEKLYDVLEDIDKNFLKARN